MGQAGAAGRARQAWARDTHRQLFPYRRVPVMSVDISTPWGDAIKAVTSLINKVIPDKSAAAAATAQLQLQSVTSAQSDVDKVEAASTSMFVAGARPFVMWVCGVGLAVSCIVSPLFTWLSALVGHPTPFPKLDDPLLQSTLAGMLGLGHITRTVEKIKGVVGNH